MLGGRETVRRAESELGNPGPLGIGTLHPADTKIVWFLRGEDCASCSLPTRDLRRLQRSGRLVPPLIFVVVAGPVDLIRDFLRQERIAATVRHMSAATYRATFGSVPLPTLLVIHHDTIRGMWPGTGWVVPDAIARRIRTGLYVPRPLELELGVGGSTPNKQMRRMRCHVT